MKANITIFAVLGFLAFGCGSSDDGPMQEAAPAGTYGCDQNDAENGHTCSGGTYENGMLTGDEKSFCEAAKGSGKGFSTQACAQPVVGCVCDYDLSGAITDNGVFHATQVFHFDSGALRSKESKDSAFIDASVWCATIGFRVASATYNTTCHGMGAPYDGPHPGPQ
jgi:hypothetical protein